VEILKNEDGLQVIVAKITGLSCDDVDPALIRQFYLMGRCLLSLEKKSSGKSYCLLVEALECRPCRRFRHPSAAFESLSTVKGISD